MKQNKTVRLLWALIALAAAACLLWMLFAPKAPGATAEIWVDGALVETVDLGLAHDGERTLQHYGKEMTVAIHDHQICVKASDCPDKVCVNAGWLSAEGEQSVCMPNRVSIHITDGSTVGVTLN